MMMVIVIVVMMMRTMVASVIIRVGDIMMWSGRDDEVPSQGRGFSVDCFTGYVAYSSILSGLLRRERTGQGQYLDVAMLDASMPPAS